MNRVLFVTQKRSDAIGIVDQNQKNELKNLDHNFDFLQIGEKGTTKFQIIVNYFKNILLLLKTARNYSQIFFSWENPYGILIKLFMPWKKITMTIHHIEEYRWKTIIGKLIFSIMDHFIAISQFTKDQLIAFWVKPIKITVNYNGISKSFYPEKLENFQDFTYILYIGTEVPRKNLKTLLSVFKVLHTTYPKLKLVKVGKPGTEEAKKETDQLIKVLWLSDVVLLHRNFISNDELRKRYSNALCYVSLATLEGFGLTIPEAMACGCPVLASRIWPFEEICQDESILIDPLDEEKIIDKIKIYLEDQNFRTLKSGEWLMKAERFDWKKNVNFLVAFFTQKTK